MTKPNTEVIPLIYPLVPTLNTIDIDNLQAVASPNSAYIKDI